MSDALIAAGPLTVVLEDLHWADAASLDLLAQVGAAPGVTRVTVIGTVRSPAPQEVGIRLAGLGRYGAVTLPLAPFTPDEVAELVDPGLASDVYQRTGGLPLLVAAVRAGSGSADLAVVVGGLLAALTPAQREVIEAAAVLGEVVNDHLLAAVVASRRGAAAAGPAAWHDDSVADALATAWHNGLLAVDDATRRYRFAHALVRDGIVDRLDPATARALHRAAALALESSADAGRAGRIAAHWRHAGTDPGTPAGGGGLGPEGGGAGAVGPGLRRCGPAAGRGAGRYVRGRRRQRRARRGAAGAGARGIPGRPVRHAAWNTAPTPRTRPPPRAGATSWRAARWCCRASRTRKPRRCSPGWASAPWRMRISELIFAPVSSPSWPRWRPIPAASRRARRWPARRWPSPRRAGTRWPRSRRPTRAR